MRSTWCKSMTSFLCKIWGMPGFCPKIFQSKTVQWLSQWCRLFLYYFKKNFFSEPSAAPINVRARNLSSTSILVQWGEVPDTDKNGIILSYTVNYKANPRDSLQQSQVVNASTREVTLTGLDKNTEYEIEVFANTSKGGGKKSEPPITVQTNEDSKYTIAQVAAAAFMGRKRLKGCEVYFSATFSWTSPLSYRNSLLRTTAERRGTWGHSRSPSDSNQRENENS